MTLDGTDFLVSVTVYSILRIPDMITTKMLASKLDLKNHEVNFVLLFLVERFGFLGSMLVTWAGIGLFVGTLDAFVVVFPGLPIYAIFFGMGHILAAVNNAEIYYRGEYFGFESVNESRIKITKILRSLDSWRRLLFVIKIDLFRFGVAGVALVTLAGLYLSSHLPPPLNGLALGTSLVMVMGLLAFFLIMAVAPLIIARRWMKTGDVTVAKEPNYTSLRLPTSEVAQAAEEAMRLNKPFVEIPLPSDLKDAQIEFDESDKK